MKFSWNDKKAASNFAKHRVSFDEATAVFDDQNALIDLDDNDDEERWQTIADQFKACCSSSTLNVEQAQFVSSRPEGPHAMKKIVTTGKRVLKGDRWHDDNGPLPDGPGEWVPPMTDDEILTAALSDPDAQPLTDAQLARMRRMSRVQLLRRTLGLTQEKFAERFHIPIGTLRDWEQGRAEPDQTARAYLEVIAASPRTVEKALKGKILEKAE